MSDQILLTDEERNELHREFLKRENVGDPQLIEFIARAQAKKALEAVADCDLLEFVNKSTRRNEAQNNMRACEDVGIPMACAAVELYREKVRTMLQELGE